MEIGGSIPQQAGVVAVTATSSQNSRAEKDDELKQENKTPDVTPVQLNLANTENRPAEGEAVGSVINTNA
jgi:hypothetical protein